MLTLFTAMGLTKQQDGRFYLTGLAREHLTASSPWDMGPYFASLRDRPICQDILQVLRTGDPFGWASKRDEAEWAKAMEREDFAAAFTAAMDSRGASLAPAMADVLDCAGFHRLLDIAGGSGIYACAVTAANPHLTAAVLEKPPVDKTARLAIARQDKTKQVSVFAADMFLDPLPPGFDIHLYSHVLHDWGTAEVKTLLRKSFDALVPGGIVVCHDAHLHPDKSGPLAVAEYSVLLMLSTQGKCYAVSEISHMLQDIGFGGHRLLPAAADRSLIIAQKPA
jgi:SAM-dependent methyltransferase